MTDKKKPQEPVSLSSPDLSVLAEFQFGPAWARESAPKEYKSRATSHRDERPGNGGGKGRGGFSKDRPRRDHGERRDREQGGARWKNDGQDRRGGRFDRNRDRERERPPLPEPAPGLRVELRPVDNGLAACAAEVNKHKRVVSLFDFAKVIMAKRERYDLVFMKQEGGPQMYASQKGDHSCWLSRDEAVKFLWQAPWFNDYYEAREEEAPAPKGEFQAIGKCSLNGELIGPVNWHGYQGTLINLHRTRYANMAFDHFKSKIRVEKGDEVVQEWLASVSKKTVWVPKRQGEEATGEGTAETVLPDAASVEKDFSEHHFDEAYVTTDKVFINGSVARQYVSPGIWAHIVKLAEVTRKHPSMLIPNLCHGLARHHMPIFKWKGGHHTGPSRPRALAEDTVLADRMKVIINWIKDNSGKRADLMLKELCGEKPEEKTSPKSKGKADQKAPGEKEEAAVETAAVDPAPEAAEAAPPATKEEAAMETSSMPAEEAVTPVDQTDAPVAIDESASTVQEDPHDASLSEIDQKRQDLVKDLFWLCDQGYVLVFVDGRMNLPKISDADKSGQKDKESSRKKKAGKKKAPAQQPAQVAESATESERQESKPELEVVATESEQASASGTAEQPAPPAESAIETPAEPADEETPA